jgi:hypothetical protein
MCVHYMIPLVLLYNFPSRHTESPFEWTVFSQTEKLEDGVFMLDLLWLPTCEAGLFVTEATVGWVGDIHVTLALDSIATASLVCISTPRPLGLSQRTYPHYFGAPSAMLTPLSCLTGCRCMSVLA